MSREVSATLHKLFKLFCFSPSPVIDLLLPKHSIYIETGKTSNPLGITLSFQRHHCLLLCEPKLKDQKCLKPNCVLTVLSKEANQAQPCSTLDAVCHGPLSL